MTESCRIRRRSLVIAAALAAPALARAQEAVWKPDRTVRMFVPFAPGGPSDTFGRIFADAFSQQIGQTVAVENRAGGGGVVGVDAVAKSRPDGLTIGITGASALVVAPALPQPMPFRVFEDLANLTPVVRVRQCVVVSGRARYRNLTDFIADAKAQREPLPIASSGATSALATALLAQEAGIQLTDVRYRGAAPALTDLLAQRVVATIVDLPVALGHIRSGDLRALAITSRTRAPELPEVQTASEQGLPGLATDNWYGLAAPGQTPENILRGLHAASVAALRSPQLAAAFAQRAGEPLPMTREEFVAFLRAEERKWAPLVKASGMDSL
ncbi:tripartite tricarboxylate transporter substrate binding protein [Roseomonas sp. AR75]|uniref:Bug family tripartite tricarboxylate transporter substrate binding protein n=1 Tax=Roseomonas sp. AR75 TaxID=2562311 RepID=UPI001485A68F|nr:tripartite tricarboxylate transporter substrate binding protein [Roseomonas sp. AR75]